LILAKPTHVFGTLRDQSGAPFEKSKVQMRQWISATKQISFKTVETEESGQFDMGLIASGKYRFLPSPTGAFRQPELISCESSECRLTLTLRANPTDTPESICPVL
jgi:hypothetical protein